MSDDPSNPDRIERLQKLLGGGTFFVLDMQYGDVVIWIHMNNEKSRSDSGPTIVIDIFWKARKGNEAKPLRSQPHD